ncbi:hypothetical protein FA95DRAFT_1601954 [Auriscalpium vulgare]|uniref:Uncharacterized protein n=1 Tax=Auriscalpium vulgare TaxID=40419 RepID=A0ACB8S720_9AGAM|nr:hypothetical protein FA95DRAFT_1601954 [Auriscalpium vulgare]
MESRVLERIPRPRSRRPSVSTPKVPSSSGSVPPSPLRWGFRAPSPDRAGTSGIVSPLPVVASPSGPGLLQVLARRNVDESRKRDGASAPGLRRHPSMQKMNVAQDMVRMRSAVERPTANESQPTIRVRHASLRKDKPRILVVANPDPPSDSDSAPTEASPLLAVPAHAPEVFEGSAAWYLRILSNGTITGEQTSCLREALRSISWLQAFVSSKGAPVLTQALVRISEKGVMRHRVDYLLEYELLLCVKEILNYEDVVGDFLTHRRIVTEMAMSLDSPHPSTRRLVLELLTFLVYRGGETVTLVIDALRELSIAHAEGDSPYTYWFRSVQESIWWTMFGPCQPMDEYKQHAVFTMLLINGIFNKVSTELGARLRHRTRMEAAGLPRILEQFRAVEDDVLTRQLDQLQATFDKDDRKIGSKLAEVHVTEHALRNVSAAGRSTPAGRIGDLPPEDDDDIVIMLKQQMTVLEERLLTSLSTAAKLQQQLELQKAEYEVKLSLRTKPSAERLDARKESWATVKERGRRPEPIRGDIEWPRRAHSMQTRSGSEPDAATPGSRSLLVSARPIKLSQSTPSTLRRRVSSDNRAMDRLSIPSQRSPRSAVSLTPRADTYRTTRMSELTKPPQSALLAVTRALSPQKQHDSSAEERDTDASAEQKLSDVSNPTDSSVRSQNSVMSIIERVNFSWAGRPVTAS